MVEVRQETLVISGVSVIFGIPEPELQCFDSGNPNGSPWLNLVKNRHFSPLYPLVMANIAIEHGTFSSLIYLLNILTNGDVPVRDLRVY